MKNNFMKIHAGYYGVVGNSGNDAGFIEKVGKFWVLSLYGRPQETYPKLSSAKESALWQVDSY